MTYYCYFASFSPWTDYSCGAASQKHKHTYKQSTYLQAKAHLAASINLPKNYFENTFLGDFLVKDEGAFPTSNILRLLWQMRGSHS